MKRNTLFIFIYRLFNDAVSIPDVMASSYGIISG
jgi:hypothetical protein